MSCQHSLMDLFLFGVFCSLFFQISICSLFSGSKHILFFLDGFFSLVMFTSQGFFRLTILVAPWFGLGFPSVPDLRFHNPLVPTLLTLLGKTMLIITWVYNGVVFRNLPNCGLLANMINIQKGYVLSCSENAIFTAVERALKILELCLLVLVTEPVQDNFAYISA